MIFFTFKVNFYDNKKMARLNFLEETRFEKVPVTVYPDQNVASLKVANRIASIIKEKQEKGEKAVLGLATGVTPIGVYKELVRLHKEEGLSFSNVVTFNLDEYYPMQPTAEQSYVTFMNKNLFDHIDISRENININSLSGGTIDQLYFALRFEIINSMSDSRLPLILDDCFIQYDDIRLENILRFIKDKSKERQIILFTCQKREMELLNKIDANYNLVAL